MGRLPVHLALVVAAPLALLVASCRDSPTPARGDLHSSAQRGAAAHGEERAGTEHRALGPGVDNQKDALAMERLRHVLRRLATTSFSVDETASDAGDPLLVTLQLRNDLLAQLHEVGHDVVVELCTEIEESFESSADVNECRYRAQIISALASLGPQSAPVAADRVAKATEGQELSRLEKVVLVDLLNCGNSTATRLGLCRLASDHDSFIRSKCIQAIGSSARLGEDWAVEALGEMRSRERDAELIRQIDVELTSAPGGTVVSETPEALRAR